ETRLRPDSLLVPSNMQLFTAVLQRNGQPVDYLLYATLTSGTTERNSSSQRDYLLTLEMIDTRSGAYTKEQAMIRKGYHKSPLGKLAKYSLLPAGR
ncbi:MAG: penicillin-binding protein activator LpoB, partial [Planctomycetales bacterium]|nr:penicillin-binding protein activator LpoB [Planctomycetales bacterium]